MSRSLLPLLTSPEGEKALNSSHHQRCSKVYGGKKKWCVLVESRKLFGIYPYSESGSKGDLQGVINEMKWKRMQSNCESARWSRMTMVQLGHDEDIEAKHALLGPDEVLENPKLLVSRPGLLYQLLERDRLGFRDSATGETRNLRKDIPMVQCIAVVLAEESSVMAATASKDETPKSRTNLSKERNNTVDIV
nr:hypothetical protein M569_12984 [Ipomoea batatas]